MPGTQQTCKWLLHECCCNYTSALLKGWPNESYEFLLGECQVTKLCSRQEIETEEGLSHALRYPRILSMTNFSGVFT